MPTKMPAEMEYASGVMQIVKKAGRASRKSPKSMSLTGPIIMLPTKTRQGAVASGGMSSITGTKVGESMKSTAVVTAQSPVRPPSWTPAAVSLWMMTGLVPITAPRPVLKALPKYPYFAPGRKPLLSRRPACCPMPCCTPAVSNTTMKRRQSTAVPNSWGFSNIGVKSKSKICGRSAPAESPAEGWFGLGKPRRCEATAVKQMPSSKAPVTFLIKSPATSKVAVKASHKFGWDRSPSATKVVSFLTTRPIN
mmetsp:Transcript_97166/g.231226  ORF Transcript_97166/g.231226 Transcript_97166/m.231226 type:complete len:251 (-) Transcript_97166:612-1364(-)